MLSGEGGGAGGVRRAGVVGSPVGHSRSPDLHRAAYRALGLTGWSFEATEVAAGALGGHVAGLGPEWVGLAVTMPLKEEALALAAGTSEVAELAGGANTLLRRADGWAADNTDVVGLERALTEAGLRAPARAGLLGGGATARSALLALHRLGVGEVVVHVRGDLRPPTRELAERLGLGVEVRRLGEGGVDAAGCDVVVSTLPPDVDPGPVVLEASATVLDVVYSPWPSRVARRARARDGAAVPVVPGSAMLLHQAVRQVELMTGHNGPVAAMRAALRTEGTGTV